MAHQIITKSHRIGFDVAVSLSLLYTVLLSLLYTVCHNLSVHIHGCLFKYIFLEYTITYFQLIIGWIRLKLLIQDNPL